MPKLISDNVLTKSLSITGCYGNLLNKQTAYMNMIRFAQKQIIKIKNSVNKLEKQKEELSKPDLKIAK